VKRVRGAALGTWEFVAGDDWITAVGVVVSLGLTAVASRWSEAWFVMPVSVGLLLALSVRRVARRLR
jgi:hypothetical protein